MTDSEQTGAARRRLPDRVLVRIAGRADWYDDGFAARSATRFPRYEVETVEATPRRGSIASFNQDDDETFGQAMAAGVALEVDAFRVHWITGTTT